MVAREPCSTCHWASLDLAALDISMENRKVQAAISLPNHCAPSHIFNITTAVCVTLICVVYRPCLLFPCAVVLLVAWLVLTKPCTCSAVPVKMHGQRLQEPCVTAVQPTCDNGLLQQWLKSLLMSFTIDSAFDSNQAKG